MCHPSYYWVWVGASPQRRLVGATARQRPAEEEGGAIVRACLCSPTNHPGSFRCRQHHGEYQWVNRLRSKST
ncbi:hypothetical protein AAHA92_09449 [Salvia divinorum]|uniref:Uncharacterized protein n=1 Tax=Salvia divinorum TaxID=28513 RepID=A0ABD1HT15_SALDI